MAKTKPDTSEYSSDTERPSQKPSYGWTDVRKYVPTKEQKMSLVGRILMFVVILALILGGTYTYAWAKSPGGQRALTNAWSWVKEYNPVSFVEREVSTAQEKVGNMWSANYNASKRGVVLNDFRVVGTAEVPAGSSMTFAYDLKLENAEVNNLPLTASCLVKGKDITTEILPTNPVIVSGNYIKESIRCRLNKEETSKMDGTYQAEGAISFPFETKEAKLRVYLTSEEIFNEIKDEDFFDYYSIDEPGDIRVDSNGEPVEVGIGISAENKQPVVLRPGFNPLIGITLTNRWGGRMLNLTEFKLILPKGITINKELSDNPSISCPFVESREGKASTEYIADKYTIQNILIERDAVMNFECWLDADPSILGQSLYVTKEYKAGIEYVYELPKKAISFTIKSPFKDSQTGAQTPLIIQ